MTLMSVDLPAPFSPSNACTSPARRSNDTPLSARTAPKDLVTEVSWRREVIEPQMNADKRRCSFGEELREDDALEIHSASFAEVDQVAQRLFRDAQVVDELGLVLREQLADGFEFDDDAFKDEQIGDVTLFEFTALVEAGQFLFGAEGDGAKFQLDFHALLVDVLGQAETAIVVNLEGRAKQTVAFVLLVVHIMVHVFLLC